MNDHRIRSKPPHNEPSHSLQSITTAHNPSRRPSLNKNFPVTNRPLARRITSTNSPILIQENASEPQKPPHSLVSEFKASNAAPKFSKNFRDVKKSLANLSRTPNSLTPSDTILEQQSQESPRKTVCDLTLANLQLRKLSNIDSKILRVDEESKGSVRGSLVKENRYGRDVASIAEFKYGGAKRVSQQYYVDSKTAAMARNLRTEGDEPVERRGKNKRDSLEDVKGKNYGYRDVNGGKVLGYGSYAKSGKNEGRRESIGNRMKFETAKKEVRKGGDNRRSSGLQGILTLNNISDDVKYGAGGVGYSAGGRREKRQEGEPLVGGGESRGKEEVNYGQNSGDKKVICVERETMSKWKHDIYEIKRDIEQRKKSYEKVEKFITNIHVQDANERGPPPALYSQNTHAGTSSQATGPTLATIPTQPAQPNFERIVSPSFSSAVNFPFVGSQHTPLFGPTGNNEQHSNNITQFERRNSRPNRDWKESTVLNQTGSAKERLKPSPLLQGGGNDYIIENERENNLCKAACCGTGSGCQMF